MQSPVKILCCFIMLIQLSFDCFATNKKASPCLFIENKGQIKNTGGQFCDDILFSYDGGGMSVFLKKTGASYVFQSFPDIHNDHNEPAINENLYVKAHRVDMHFVGANTAPEIITGKKQQPVFNFYIESQSIENVSGFENILYKNIYPNVDASFYASESSHIKYDFIVNPGGSPDAIGLYYLGAENVSIDGGVLKVTTSLGNVTETIPRVYQQINGIITDVKAFYTLEDEIVKIKTGNYDKNYPLIIDPWVTFFGGSRIDFADGIEVDNNGNIIITGGTNTALFPITPGVFQTTFGGGNFYDIFVSKFDNNGALVFSTLFGGSGNDIGHGVTSDASGNIYVAGECSSAGLGTAGAFRAAYSGNTDAIIVKFSPVGSRIWANYYGAGYQEKAMAINLDNTGNVCVAGNTTGAIPTSVGSFQPAYRGGTSDAFLLKLSNDGITRLFCTHVGGNQADYLFDMDVDPVTNDIVIAGGTISVNFPVSLGAYQATKAGGTDNYIARFDGNGFRIWATYFGGSLQDVCNGVAFDGLGNIIICGITQSVDLPTSASSFQQNSMSTINDAYLGKFNSTGAFQWVTYYGNGWSEGYGVAINKANNDIFLLGGIYGDFLPMWNCGHQPANGGGNVSTNQAPEDSYIARFDSEGQHKCNTYMGGFGHDEGANGGIVYFNGDVYTCGHSEGDYSITPNAYQSVYGGGSRDAAIARICGYTCGDNTVDADFTVSKDSICPGEATDFSDISILCDASEVKWQWTFQGGAPSSSTQQNPSNIIYNTQGSFPVKLVVETPCGKDSLTLNNYIHVSKPHAIINSTTDVSCFGFSNGGASVGISSGRAPFSFSWSPVTGTNSSISNLAAGNYSVTVTDKIGCTSSVATVISEPPLLVVSASTLANAGCSGMAGIVSASVTGGTPGYNYTWNTSPVQLVQTVSNLSVGIYSVTVSDLNGCTSIATVTVTPSVSPPLVVSVVSAVSVCEGGSVVLTAQASGGGNVYSYNWLPGNSTGNSIVVSPSSATSYSVIVNDNCNSPADTAVVFVTVNQLPSVSFNVTDSAGCVPLCISFNNTTINTNSCSWDFGDGTITSQNSSVHCYNDPGSYSVSLTVTDNNGCSSSLSRANFINVYPNPIAAFSSGPASVNLLEPTVYFTDRSTGATSWLWSFGDVLNSGDSSQHTSFSYPDSGRYVVQLIVQNDFGCVDSAFGVVYINPAFAFYIPNSFSPNNDGLNDVFRVTGMGISEGNFEMLIFDRWGNMVFVSEDINKGWNGMIKGAPAIIDTYVWKVALKTLEEKVIRKAGHVNVIR